MKIRPLPFVFAVILMLSVLSGCGGNVEVPEGHFIPESSTAYYSYIQIRDGEITLGRSGGVLPGFSVFEYTVKKDILSLTNGVSYTLDGTSAGSAADMEIRIEVIDKDSFKVSGTGITGTYVRDTG